MNSRYAQRQVDAQLDAWAKSLGELLAIAIINVGSGALLYIGLRMAGLDFWPTLLISLGLKGMTHRG